MFRTGTRTTSVVPSRLLREEERFLAGAPLPPPALDFLPERRTTFFLPLEGFFLVAPFLVFFLFRFSDLANLAPFTVFVRHICRPVLAQA